MKIAVITTVGIAAIFLFVTMIMNLGEDGEINLEIRKAERRLDVFAGRRLVKSFPVVLGFDPIGDKEVEGDGRTPLGQFYVFTKNEKSRFHLSLGVSYPNAEDADRGLASGLITRGEFDAITGAINNRTMPPQKTALGGEIYIHGGGLARDWTDGCIALDNNQMTELFELVPVGAQVTIFR